ncbi:MAG: hypothetical protein GF334_10395 [Candidatus Altiarchaeales archaeon]|nr:hypothetical protein [Candidatus Altiarchaeales archaeon]
MTELQELGSRLRHALRFNDMREAMTVARLLEEGKVTDPEPTSDFRCSNCGSQNWTVWFHDVDARGISRVDVENKVFYSPFEGEMIGATESEERNRLWCNNCNTNHELSEGWVQDFEED